ncbi:MAG: nucleotide exchange factor GrpE [bacterium]|nr:nucleotide exchange factor GrpE [bacterium]
MEEQNNETQDNISPQPTDAERALIEAQEEARTNLNGWQRAQADFENYKRREEAKQKDIFEFAKEVVVAKILPTLDSLEQGLKHIPEVEGDKLDQWKRGIDGTLQQLAKALEEMGVKRVEAVGKPFDPNFHEAVREVPGEVDDIVVEELQSGYELNGKVIRPSQVVVSRKQ